MERRSSDVGSDMAKQCALPAVDPDQLLGPRPRLGLRPRPPPGPKRATAWIDHQQLPAAAPASPNRSPPRSHLDRDQNPSPGEVSTPLTATQPGSPDRIAGSLVNVRIHYAAVRSQSRRASKLPRQRSPDVGSVRCRCRLYFRLIRLRSPTFVYRRVKFRRRSWTVANERERIIVVLKIGRSMV